MARILLMSRDPGGANVIIPLVRPLRARGHEALLFGKDFALEKYARAGLEAIDIRDRVGDVTQESITRLVAAVRPDMICTATSADDFSERFLWKAAGIFGVYSIAILDQWINYGIRFSDFPVSEIGLYLARPSHPYLPSKILVMDETARTEAIAAGLDSARLVVTGQPHFESVLKTMDSIEPRELEGIRAHFGVEHGDRLVTFASEPISDTYGSEEAGREFWGYSERTVFAALLRSVAEIAERHSMRVGIVIRLHPKEDAGYFENLMVTQSGKRTYLRIDREIDAVKLMKASDLVCGMSSMFLIEAAVANVPVISVQIGLKRENPFVLDRSGAIPSVLETSSLQRELERYLVRHEQPRYGLGQSRDAVRNIVMEMEGSLCRNSQ